MDIKIKEINPKVFSVQIEKKTFYCSDEDLKLLFSKCENAYLNANRLRCEI